MSIHGKVLVSTTPLQNEKRLCVLIDHRTFPQRALSQYLLYSRKILLLRAIIVNLTVCQQLQEPYTQVHIGKQ